MVKANWKAPTQAAVHWDGKIMEDLKDKYKCDDCLPVLVSGDYAWLHNTLCIHSIILSVAILYQYTVYKASKLLKFSN